MPKPAPKNLTIDAETADRSIQNHLTPLAKIKPKAIKTATEYKQLAGTLRDIKRQQAALDKDRDQIIKPIRQGLDVLYAKFREATRFLKDLETDIKSRMESYQAAQTRKALKAAEKKAAKAPNAEMAADIMTATIETTHAPKVDGISYRVVWEAKIIDPAKVPTQWGDFELRPIDTKLLNRLASTGANPPPGVEYLSQRKLTAKVG